MHFVKVFFISLCLIITTILKRNWVVIISLVLERSKLKLTDTFGRYDIQLMALKSKYSYYSIKIFNRQRWKVQGGQKSRRAVVGISVSRRMRIV